MSDISFVSVTGAVHIGQGIYLDTDGTYLQFESDSDSGAACLTPVELGCDLPPVPRPMPRRPGA